MVMGDDNPNSWRTKSRNPVTIMDFQTKTQILSISFFQIQFQKKISQPHPFSSPSPPPATSWTNGFINHYWPLSTIIHHYEPLEVLTMTIIDNYEP